MHIKPRLSHPGHLASALAPGAPALLPPQASAQIAAGKDKFVGNVIGQSIPSSFATDWNKVTPETPANALFKRRPVQFTIRATDL
jgi:hypothetical protein